MPLSEDFSWGMIRIVDRLRVTNEYLTFGGRLDAGSVDDAIVAAFTSPAPLLRRGGHSQGWDAGADLVGAFFARMMVAVDFVQGFETATADASPTVRYAAFIHDAGARRRADSPTGVDSDLGRLIRHESVRLRLDLPDDWAAGSRLLAASEVAQPTIIDWRASSESRPADEPAVQLHERRPELQDVAQAGKPGSRIVDGEPDARAEPGDARRGRPRSRDHRRVLRHLEDQRPVATAARSRSRRARPGSGPARRSGRATPQPAGASRGREGRLERRDLQVDAERRPTAPPRTGLSGLTPSLNRVSAS